MTLHYNPFDAEQAQDPFDKMKELRSKCPISKINDNMWYFSKYEDIRKGFSDFRTFSNAGGFAITEQGKNVDDLKTTLIQMDPPEHTKLRRFIISSLNARTYRTASDYITELVKERIENLKSKEKPDVVEDMIKMIPGTVFCHITGIPVQNQAEFVGWIDELLELADSQGKNTADIFASDDLPEQAVKMLDFLEREVSERKNSSNPPDDLITQMIQYEDPDDGSSLTDQEIVFHLRFIIFGGYETTKGFLSNLLYEFVTNPELYERVRNDQSLIPAAIEESLRTSPPFKLIMRTVTKDIEMKGVNIQKGDRIVLGLQSGNRDEEVFGEDAAEFNIDREKPAEVLSFGKGGPHHCPGAALARLEGEIVLREFLNAFTEVKLDPNRQVKRSHIYWQNGYVSIPVILPE